MIFPSHEKLEKYIEDNKHLDWKDFLLFYKKFSHQGNYGYTGLFITKDKQKLVYKISQDIGYVVRHEKNIMKILNPLRNFCPHFCKIIDSIKIKSDLISDKNNPFQIKTKYSIEKEVILMEYISKLDFYTMIKDQLGLNACISVIKQILMAIHIAQQEKSFSHYDLHIGNVMIRKTNLDDVFLYILDDETQICIPTFGFFPVIIDFGFTYTKDCEDKPLYPGMSLTEIGFTSNCYDPIVDLKVFLISTSSHLKQIYGKKKKIKLLRNIVKNTFKSLKVDFYSGHDIKTEKSICGILVKFLEKKGDKFTKKYKSYLYDYLELIQTLIILPLEDQTYEGIHSFFEIFLREFDKISEQFSRQHFPIYILKSIIDIARDIRYDYSLGGSSRIHAMKFFRDQLFGIVENLGDYVDLKNVSFETMLCALYCFSDRMEGFFYLLLHQKTQNKQKLYENLPIKTPLQFYGALETNLSHKYIFTPHTNIVVMDARKKIWYEKKIDEIHLDKLNDTHPISQGNLLYKILNI